MRYLALDWGTVRVGGAISDPEGKIAFPLEKFIESQTAIAEIKKLIAELSVEKVLIGLPKGLNNQDTASTEKTETFVANLKTEISQPIELLDERFSSIAAAKSLSGQGIKEKDQRNMKDNLAAQLMLQQYLDSNNNNN